jgi:hypothetical protein
MNLESAVFGGMTAPFRQPYIRVTNFDLTDEETAALIRELDRIIEDDRYPLSTRIRTLRDIHNKIRPEPEREPLPLPKHYEPTARVGATLHRIP